MSDETVADRRVDPATIALRFVREAPRTVLALPAGYLAISGSGLTRALWVAAAVAVVVVALHILSWSRFKYGVGSDEVVIEQGVLHRSRRSIPFERIQDIDIERRLLARLFGLAKVKIETGAGGKDEGLLDSVTVAEADRLRATVRAWRAGDTAPQAEAGEGAPPVPEARVLFAMDVPRVLLFGLFNFSLAYLAGLFALLQLFDDWLPFDIYDPARWMGLVGEYLPHRWSAGAIATLLVLAILIGLVAGVLRTLARDYGYRLSVEGDRFRRERGLFTRSEAVIARRRVQLARLRSGPLRGLFGWWGLSFQTLGAGSDGGGSQMAAPFARREELEPVLAEVAPLRLPEEGLLQPVSSRHIVRSLLHAVALPCAVILAAAIAEPRALWLLALVPMIALGAALDRRFHRYALDGELLFVTRGVLIRRLWVIPVARAHSIGVARGWLQRRLGLATLSVDTAGAPVTGAPRILDLRLEVARGLAEEIAARRRAYSGRKSGTER
jgi:putative membrane protein